MFILLLASFIPCIYTYIESEEIMFIYIYIYIYIYILSCTLHDMTESMSTIKGPCIIV